MKREQTNERVVGIASAAGASVLWGMPSFVDRGIHTVYFTLILGIFLYHEPFTGVHLASFIVIWLALTIFSLARTRSFMQLESMLLKK